MRSLRSATAIFRANPALAATAIQVKKTGNDRSAHGSFPPCRRLTSAPTATDRTITAGALCPAVMVFSENRFLPSSERAFSDGPTLQRPPFPFTFFLRHFSVFCRTLCRRAGKLRRPWNFFCHPADENITWIMETEWPKFKMKARCEEQFIPGKLGTGFVEVCHDLSVSW